MERQRTYRLYLKLMGMVYFCAFFSLFFQIGALIGEDGILPAGTFLNRVAAANGDGALLQCPTIFWLSASNAALYTVTALGSLLSLCLVAGILPALTSLLLYLLYLSIVSVGQIFLGYQWDFLLLESGFITIIAALLREGGDRRLKVLVTWLFVYLNFHLMFSSGRCKLASGDPTWSDLTALSYHFFTQPLPTPLAIFAGACPLALSKCICWLTLAVELAVPFLLLCPRTLRIFACIVLALLQVAIIFTGNYGFFNILSMVILIPLLDDVFLTRAGNLAAKIVPANNRDLIRRLWTWEPIRLPRLPQNIPNIPAITLAALLLFNDLAGLGGRFAFDVMPTSLSYLRMFSQTCGISNSYGLFAVMTRERPEIIVEGSNDGVEYKAYQFKYKVSRLDQAPPIVAPGQPRLDWQMWFESLNATYGEPYDPHKGLNPQPGDWFVKFLGKLSEGDRTVLGQMAFNPFPEEAPKFLRARVVNYNFVTPAELLKTGRWWRSTDVGLYTEYPLSTEVNRNRP